MDNKLQKLENLSDKSILINSLRQSIVLVFDRTNTSARNIDGIVIDILKEFPDITDDEITNALRNGSLGKYGKTYKLSTQEMCCWIRNYRDDKKINWDFLIEYWNTIYPKKKIINIPDLVKKNLISYIDTRGELGKKDILLAIKNSKKSIFETITIETFSSSTSIEKYKTFVL